MDDNSDLDSTLSPQDQLSTDDLFQAIEKSVFRELDHVKRTLEAHAVTANRVDVISFENHLRVVLIKLVNESFDLSVDVPS